MVKKKSPFVCQNCGYKSAKYLGRCPNCGEWSSFVEEVEVQEVKNQRVSMTGERSKPLKLDEVELFDTPRIETDLDEFNRVLGRRSWFISSDWGRPWDREINLTFTGFYSIGF